MKEHRKVSCESDSDSDHCVAERCRTGCVAPYNLQGRVFEVSSMKCSSSDCGDQIPSDLCSSDTMSKCPEVSHCEKVFKSKKRKHHRKGKKCKKECSSDDKDWSKLLCGSDDESDDCSSSGEKCTIPAPIAPCTVAKNRYWDVSSCSDSSDDDSEDTPKESRNFHITLMSKRGHPHMHRILGSHALAVNGIPGKDIHLTRGHTYKFFVSSGAENFFFTEDPMGGKAGVHADLPSFKPAKIPGSPDPVSNGSFEVTAGPDFPKIFHYQSQNNGFLGGLAFVHDK